MLPWDWDIDTQVSEATLRFMSVHHNMTKYDYVAKDDPTFKRTYLLDVNPAIVERERGNGKNVIDARFIDVSNGLYVDVTGLSETHPEDKPGVWSCKNYHRYLTTELYPMRETVFEGVTAKVPYAYDRLLVQEYTAKALVVTDYEGCVSICRDSQCWRANVVSAIDGILRPKSGRRSPTKKYRRKRKH